MKIPEILFGLGAFLPIFVAGNAISRDWSPEWTLPGTLPSKYILLWSIYFTFLVEIAWNFA